MNGEEAGPSGVQGPSKGLFACFKRNNDVADSEKKIKLALLDRKEKENKIEFHFLRMNNEFITGFQTGYHLPWDGIRGNAGKKLVRCTLLRRKRSRPHPYKGTIHLGPDYFNTKESDTTAVEESPYRLRTTSLSSGTANKKKLAPHKRQPREIEGLKRSRSMEDLSATIERDCTISLQTKDLDTVSQGIQQLHMEDTP